MAFGRHRRPILAAGRPPSEADFGRWAPDEVVGRFYLTGFALDLVDD